MAAEGTSGTDQGSLTARPYLPALAPDRIAGSDLLVSAFIAALSHYKRATVALPFPSELFCVQPASGAREKDFEAAQRAAEAVPSLRSLAAAPCTSDASPGSSGMGMHAATLPEAAHQLLEWLLVPSTRRAPALRHISMQHLQSQLQQARPGWQFDPPRESTPTYAFEVQPQGSSPCTPLSSPIIAFHGTSFERLHSILSTGLQPGTGTRLQRNGGIFGEGIYLSTDYGVAFSFCNPATGWRQSGLGWKLRAMLVCQVESSCATDSGSDTTLPPYYVLVKQPGAVRITHVLVYCDELAAPSLGADTGAASKGQRRRVDWCMLLVVLYGGFMLLQFVLQDRRFRRWLGLGR